MESNNFSDKKEYPPKKKLDINENKNDLLSPINILTNLSNIKLDENSIKGVYLYGCDIEEENKVYYDFNSVNIMRKARKLKSFQDELKKHFMHYYITGLILIGRPSKENEKEESFKFFLKIKEIEGGLEGEILEKYENNNDKENDKIYKFKFKRKKEDLSKMKEGETMGDLECIANYMNICLGKILKKCGYTKDRSTRKILYYNKSEIEHAKTLTGSDFLFFPALKAVCETYEGGIFMKLLPKRLLKTSYTYADYFYSIGKGNLGEVLETFKKNVINKRALKTYNQAFIKIEDIIYENPYCISFNDKKDRKWSVGEYFTKYWRVYIPDEKMPIAVRIVDKGGKLKGKDISYIYIPCNLLEIIGNIFDENINVKQLVQFPFEKYNEIIYINNLIEQNAKNSKENDLHYYLGDKFSPLVVDGQIIKPPLIIFDKNEHHEAKNGNFDLLKSSPYSKIKELRKIDIYLLNLDNGKGEIIWNKLEEASKELGITFKEKPNFNNIPNSHDLDTFQSNIYDYFNKEVNEKYSNKKNETDFIFMFMDSKLKCSFHYKVFKSVINKFNWSIPTQVILFDEKKFSKKSNLSQFTNILCQMWAKKGNELYICDFGFIPKTIVVAYSSMVLSDRKILTSLSVSLGSKLYEYIFYSNIEENNNIDVRFSLSIRSLLSKALISIGKHMKKSIDNIVIYRDSVNEKQQKFISLYEIDYIKKAIEDANNVLEKKIYSNAKWCLILVSKINEIRMFLEGQNGGNNFNSIDNIPVGTIIDNKITSKDKFDFYLNSAESRQGTCSPTHYTVLYDDTELKAFQIYKLTYYLTYLSYNTTKSIRIPAPLYFVTRRNKFTSENLNGEIINQKSRTLNISL